MRVAPFYKHYRNAVRGKKRLELCLSQSNDEFYVTPFFQNFDEIFKIFPENKTRHKMNEEFKSRGSGGNSILVLQNVSKFEW